MTDLLPPHSFAAFLIASLALALTPGPGVLYIVSRSLAQGRRAGLLSVAGIALGNLGNALGAAVGLAAVFEISAAAFSALKYAGAIYLVYLGIRLLRSAAEAVAAPDPAASARIFRDGFVVALLNPKTTLFFAAFLPQFFSPGAPPMLQGLALGSLFVAIAAVTDLFYALTAGIVAPVLHAGRGFLRRASGGMFVGLGIFTALADPRGVK